MTVTHSSDVARQEAEGWYLQVLASPASGADEVVVMRGGVEAGGSFPPHSHDRQEVLVILAGSGRYTIGDESGDVRPGDTVVVPAGALHAFEALENLDAVAILPAGARTFAPDGSEITR
jgi:quercetin dioxygenase-like cupin family protein